MKNHSNDTRRYIETGTGFGVNDKDRVVPITYREETDSIMTSNKFIEKFKVYIDDMAVTKESVDNGRKKKSFRSTDYSSIGVMDRNDLVQEAYLSLFGGVC